MDNGSIIGVESGDVTSSSVETWDWRPGTGAPLSPRRQQTFLAITHRHSQPQYVSRLDVGLVFQTCDNITVITRRIRCTQFWALACILSWTSPHISGWESCSVPGFSIILGLCGHLVRHLLALHAGHSETLLLRD